MGIVTRENKSQPSWNNLRIQETIGKSMQQKTAKVKMVVEKQMVTKSKNEFSLSARKVPAHCWKCIAKDQHNQGGNKL